MSFDPRLEHRWRSVIMPAIGEVKIDGTPLEAHRVDARSVSDSILTEILSGIGNALVVFGDLTSLDTLNGVTLRNPNVFYELGIAHSMRLPEEVLLFRSDDGPLIFDVANIRVNRYDPDGDPVKAQAQVRESISAALKEINLTRNLVVENYAARLDSKAWLVLVTAHNSGRVLHPIFRTIGEAVWGSSREAAIGNLLQLGLLETDYQAVGPGELEAIKEGKALEKLFRYRITPLGRAVLDVCVKRLGLVLQSSQEQTAP
jgi:hypothetical protein